MRSPAPHGGPGLPPGLVVEVVEATSSTNALVGQRARDGDPAWLVVAAEQQSAGRGRLDRSWVAPARSALTFSVLLRPEVPVAAWPWLPLLTGYAVDRALRTQGHRTGLKWPNDLLVADRKVAGILVERVETSTGPAAVVGIGLNVDQSADELPVPTATSLRLEAAPADPPIDRTGLLLALVASLAEVYDDWQSSGPQGARRLADAYAAGCVTLGRQVRVDLPDGGVLEGRADAIDAHGRLVVAGPAGRTAVGAGDVVHVRAVPE